MVVYQSVCRYCTPENLEKRLFVSLLGFKLAIALSVDLSMKDSHRASG